MHAVCNRCGYDLTGAAAGDDGIICPECGDPWTGPADIAWRERFLSRDTLGASGIAAIASCIVMIAAMLVAHSQLGVLASIPVLAFIGPACGAVYGAVAALRRRARGLYAFGPWINACCCATSAVVGVLGAYFLWGVISGFAFGAFWQ